jgi:hypothetical protein
MARQPGPPHYRGFTITLRHTTIGRTPLDEWSARRRYLYLTTHNRHKRQISMPRLYSNPQSQQVSGRRLTPYSARLLGSSSKADSQQNSNRQNETIMSNRCHQVSRCLQKSLALFDIEVHILQLSIIIYFRTSFTEQPFLLSCSDLFLPTYCKCRGLLTSDHTQWHTHTRLRLLWTTVQPDAVTSTWQHATLNRQTSMPPAKFEPTIPASERPLTHALDRAVTGINLLKFSTSTIIHLNRTEKVT